AVPKGTPPGVIDTLNKAMNGAFADAGMVAKLADTGGAPLPGTPAEFAQLMAGETEKWGKVVKAAGIKPEETAPHTPFVPTKAGTQRSSAETRFPLPRERTVFGFAPSDRGLRVGLALRIDHLLELAERAHARQQLLQAAVRRALLLNRGDEFAVLQLD